uniref:Uncharacterized protein n=1 Tax=Oryza meridionalis TaxID=40149 RepID=A0A0E0C352_9ORYZ
MHAKRSELSQHRPKLSRGGPGSGGLMNSPLLQAPENYPSPQTPAKYSTNMSKYCLGSSSIKRTAALLILQQGQETETIEETAKHTILHRSGRGQMGGRQQKQAQAQPQQCEPPRRPSRLELSPPPSPLAEEEEQWRE